MGDTHKIHVKLGEFEFSGEGTEGALKEQFDKFLDAIKAVPARTPAEPKPRPDGTGTGNGRPHTPTVDGPLMQRVFNNQVDGQVSLKTMPKGDDSEVDALLLLLFGYEQLRGQDTVMATDLIRAARQSGVQAGRIDRTLTKKVEFVTIAGRAKGRKYGLNNPGKAKAQEILTKILD